MFAGQAINPGSILVLGIHSESDDHYIGGPMSVDLQWHMK